MSRDEALAALRSLVDLLEANPVLPVPQLESSTILPSEVDVLAAVSDLAPCSLEPTTIGDYAIITRDFGCGIKYRLFLRYDRIGAARTEVREVTEWQVDPRIQAAMSGTLKVAQ